MHIELSTAFVLGLLSILSPCTFVIIPMVASHAATKARNIFLFLTGFVLMFAILGMLAAYTGKLLTNFLGPWLYIIAGSITLFTGLYLLDVLPIHVPLFSFHKPQNNFLFGLLFGGIGLSCMGPQLAAVLSIIFAKANIEAGFFLMAAYALGFSLPFILFGTSLSSKPFQKFFLRHVSLLQKVSGLLLIGTALYLFSIVIA